MKLFSFVLLALAIGAALFIPAPKPSSVAVVASGDPPPVCPTFPFCDDK